MIDRPEYILELERHKDKASLIKVVTGVRRSGKSTLLYLFQEKLKKDKISNNRIINISLEGIENEDLRNGKVLYSYVKDRIKTEAMYYVLIDEVQLASDYEEAVNSLRLLKNVDLYVTGSNSNIISSKLATRWAGRYVEIKMLPLSFKEYVSAFSDATSNLDIIFKHYLEQSSFPEVIAYYESSFINGEKKQSQGKWDTRGVRAYLETIYNSIMVKDVMLQHGIKEVALMDRVVKYLFSNIGSETSIGNIVNMLNSDLKWKPNEKKVYSKTLENYIDGLLKSFVFYKVERKVIKGREHLKTNAKYYAVDAGLRYFLLGDKGADSGHILENIVYLELLRRGYKVFIGKIGEKEVDFVAEGADGTTYYQVAETVHGKETLLRELAPLEAIHDNYPKIILTRDYEVVKSYDGIKQFNVLEWLLR